MAKTSASWDGNSLPGFTEDGEPEVTIARIRILPGVSLPMHKHPVINAGVLISGNLTVVTEDGEEYKMKAGDSIVEVVNKWHYGKNDGDTVADIIVVYAGLKGTPITILKK